MKIPQLFYFAQYGFKTLVLRQRKPIIAGIPLTDVCNLHCKHCVVANVGRGHYPIKRIEDLLRHFYKIGVRIIYFQGGEIMTWQDGDLRVNDVIKLARRIGFYKVAVVTNGTMGMNIDADLVWVSIDGTEPVHDSIRGKGAFAQTMHYLKSAPPKRVNLNMTINRLNYKEVESVAGLARFLPSVNGVSFNFHTPYPGVDDLSLPLDERAKVIDLILGLKKRGFPVLNTTAGLKALRTNRWRRPVPLIHLVEKDAIFECCFGRETPGVCEKCGYGVVAELSQVMSGNLSAMMGSLVLFK